MSSSHQPIAELVPGADLGTFLHIFILVTPNHRAFSQPLPMCFPPPSLYLQLGSRYFGFYRDGQSEALSSHLVPLMDLINHADDPNAERGGALARPQPAMP